MAFMALQFATNYNDSAGLLKRRGNVWTALVNVSHLFSFSILSVESLRKRNGVSFCSLPSTELKQGGS